MPRVGGTFEFGPVAPRLREAIGIFQGRRLETWPSGLRSHRYGIDCASVVPAARYARCLQPASSGACGRLPLHHFGAHSQHAARPRHSKFPDFAGPQQRQPDLQIGGIAYRHCRRVPLLGRQA